MMEVARVQESWALSIADSPTPVPKYLQATDYTWNGDQMLHNIIEDSKLAFIQSVSHNCLIIEISNYIPNHILILTKTI